VPAGGQFDGIAGVIAALEVVHYLNEHQIELPFDLEIVDYLGEELNVWGHILSWQPPHGRSVNA
jgi:hypothetical protein